MIISWVVMFLAFSVLLDYRAGGIMAVSHDRMRPPPRLAPARPPAPPPPSAPPSAPSLLQPVIFALLVIIMAVIGLRKHHRHGPHRQYLQFIFYSHIHDKHAVDDYEHRHRHLGHHRHLNPNHHYPYRHDQHHLQHQSPQSSCRLVDGLFCT